VARAIGRARRVGIFAVGKAAAGMFDVAAAPGRRGLVVLPRGHPAPVARGATVLFSAHPQPDASSVAAARAAERFFAAQPEIASAFVLADGRLEIALLGDEDTAAAVAFRAMSSGHRISAFGPVASDLEELFLQVTASSDGAPA